MPTLPVGSSPVQSANVTQAQSPAAASTPTPAAAPRSQAPADSVQVSSQPAPQGTRPADGLKAFSELTSKQQALLGEGGEVRYDALTSKERLAFQVLTTRMDQLGLDTSGLKLKQQPEGIQQDRLMFEPGPGLDRLKGQVKAGIDSGVFKSDKPQEKHHPGMTDFGARQWNTRESMQIGMGKQGAFVDVDRFGAKTDLVGLFGHIGEVLTPGKTDLAAVAKRLHIDVASRLPEAK